MSAMTYPLLLLIAAWVGLLAGFGAWALYERRRDASCDQCQRATVACRCEQERARERAAEWWAEA